jgi:hypothetical protein
MEISETQDVTQALTAKSQTATLDDLRKKGRSKVKVIKAGDVAAMITETVYRLLHDTEMLTDEEIDILIGRGAQEFKKVFSERQKEAKEMATHLVEVQQELTAAKERVAELEGLLAGQSTTGGADAPNADLMMRMMNEMAEMKARLVGGGGGGDAGAGAAGADAMADALSKITASMDERLEKLGRQMGVSSAVDAEEVDYSSLFNDDVESKMESNMGDVKVKQNKGGGIAGNLAKLKKLKGDG